MAFIVSATLSSLLLFGSLMFIAWMFADARGVIVRALRGEIVLKSERLVTAVEPLPTPCPTPIRSRASYREWQPLPLAA